jgi:uncharacterized membrane protein YqgA involved in biofilm formation
MKNRLFFLKFVSCVYGVGLIAFSLKWTTYFENWYWLPKFPNSLDALFIIVGGLLILLWGLLFLEDKDVKIKA